ncbi:MAG: effector binding domain-containing protein [Candidatus Thorarchaeota archaeon]|jgi:DNA gyrase inhibitor GyrI/DNA-binding HxlR family transcriptional regulator
MNNPVDEGKPREVSLSDDAVAEYFLTVSHPKRIRILSLLAEESMDFSDLLSKTGIRKTALSNQLTKLTEKRLIQRVSHGHYALTKDGKLILRVIIDTYKKSRLSKEEEKKRILERYSYRSDETMTKEIQVEIVQLDPMTVASIQAISKSPEDDAWKKVVAFAEPRGLLKDLKKNPIFGFNNPNPSKGKEEYGYEFWIRINPDMKVEEGAAKKEFSGGLYAVTRCNLTKESTSAFLHEHGMLESWANLSEWFKSSGYKKGKHQWLEKSVNPKKPDEDLLLDLYLPITK